jgi:SLT domain-containing protein
MEWWQFRATMPTLSNLGNGARQQGGRCNDAGAHRIGGRNSWVRQQDAGHVERYGTPCTRDVSIFMRYNSRGLPRAPHNKRVDKPDSLKQAAATARVQH